MSSITSEPTDDELRAHLCDLELHEKLLLLSGKNVWETQPIERLGIPSLKMSDGPNGARGGSFYDGTTAACFPASVSLAATFNRSLTRRIGQALGQEAQTKGAYVLLGPTVCCHRSPLGGRNFEAFSEDPLLSGLLGSEYVQGLQSERVGATVKHFLANEQDTRRFSVDQTISERALREIYLRPFELVVKNSDPWCIMTSYPKINGTHVDAQARFIQNVLRDQWGFHGLVMSDWGATSNHVESVHYGLDLEMPGPPRHRTVECLSTAVKNGQIQIQDVDERVLALLQLLRKTGKFTDRKEPVAEKAVDLREHRDLIREAGSEGIVLLKNRDGILPIDLKRTKKIAIVGPLAKIASAHGGGSASLNCHYKVNPYDAFVNSLGSDIEISYSEGAHIFRVYPDLETGALNRSHNPGFIADFFKSKDMSGSPFYTEEYPRGAFMTLMNLNAAGAQAVRFSTTYTPPQSGNHYLSFSGLGPSKLYINKIVEAEQVKETRDSMGFLLGVQDERRFQYTFDASQSYDIVIETIPSQVSNSELFLLDGQIAAHLGFVPQAEMEADLLAEAVALARDADLAVCFVGNTAQWETEGQDLASMALPADGSQDALVAGVVAANPRTVVVNTTGVAVEMHWLEDVPAVLQAWYAGQESGNAVLDVLLGATNPSGKLPVSWPRRYEHTGCYGNFGLDSYETAKVEYVEGVHVGYRHFDRYYGTEKEVLFPFGYGLSYTTFDVSGAELSGDLGDHALPGKVTVSVSVKNMGTRAGAETVQVYVEPPKGGSANGRPPKALVGFSKVFLEAGETQNAKVTFSRDGAAYWDDREAGQGGQQWRVEGEEHIISVATSSAPRDAKARLMLNVAQEFAFSP